MSSEAMINLSEGTTMGGFEFTLEEVTSLTHLLRRVGQGDEALMALAARLPGANPCIKDRLFPPDFDVAVSHGVEGTMKVSVSRKAEAVLSYERNYHSFGTSAFAPFRIGEKWMALASRDYTCTELLDLSTGNWIGGEMPDALGFCPIELFVPRWKAFRCTNDSSDRVRYVTECEADLRLQILERRVARGEIEWVGEGYAKVGFVSGCVWGDDSSLKVEAFDLRRADEGLIRRVAPWGYAELPGWALGLSDAIRFDAFWTPEDTRCGLAMLSQADAVVPAVEA